MTAATTVNIFDKSFEKFKNKLIKKNEFNLKE